MKSAAELAAELEAQNPPVKSEDKPVDTDKLDKPADKLDKPAELSTEEQTELDSLLSDKPVDKSTDKPTDKPDDAPTGKFTPEQEKEISEAKELLSNPHIKALADYIKKGGNMEDALAKLKPAGVDYDKMKDEDVFELELNRLGLDDDAKKNSRDHFSKMAPYEKKQQIEKIKTTFKSIPAEKSDFATILGEPAQAKKPTEEQLQKFRINQKNSLESLNKDLDKLVAEGYLGVPVTKEVRDEIESLITKMPANSKDAEGIPTYDYKDLLEYSLYKKFKDDVIAKAKKAGGEAVYRKLRRPNTEQVNNTGAPGSGKSESEEAKLAISEAFNKQ